MAIASWFGTDEPKRYNLHKATHSIVLQEKYGYEISSITRSNRPYKEYYDAFVDADLVLMNNGFRRNIIRAGRAARDLGKNIIYTEAGVMPQRGYVSLDDKGLFCTHSLCHDLSWVQESHIERYRKYVKGSHYNKYKNLKNRESKMVLCCLQIARDAQITYCTKLRNSNLIDKCFELYPDKNIVIRFHPKMRDSESEPMLQHIKRKYSGKKYTLFHTSAAKKVSFLSQASRSDVIIALNSTSLIESMIINKDVVALADCPIKNQLLDVKLSKNEFEIKKEKLLAGYFSSQYKKKDYYGAERVLERFKFL